ncbi:hypothetical protein KIPB_015429, partial [Kipferlia bialata]|eukprot:g15429.t1
MPNYARWLGQRHRVYLKPGSNVANPADFEADLSGEGCSIEGVVSQIHLIMGGVGDYIHLKDAKCRYTVEGEAK